VPTVGHSDIYKYYKHQRDTTKDLLTKEQYMELMRWVNTEIWRSVVEDIWIFRMPYDLGVLYIEEAVSEPNGPDPGATYIDWVATRREGRHVRRHNTHTNGRRFTITLRYRPIGVGVKNRKLYRFHVTKAQGGPKKMLTETIMRRASDPKLKDYRAHPSL
jgi:hypothetical protein